MKRSIKITGSPEELGKILGELTNNREITISLEIEERKEMYKTLANCDWDFCEESPAPSTTSTAATKVYTGIGLKIGTFQDLAVFLENIWIAHDQNRDQEVGRDFLFEKVLPTYCYTPRQPLYVTVARMLLETFYEGTSTQDAAEDTWEKLMKVLRDNKNLPNFSSLLTMLYKK